MSLDQFRRALVSDAARSELFQSLEAEAFSEEDVQPLYPDLLSKWKRVGGALQVPWQYVMVMDLSLTAMLSPTAVLFPFKTLRIYPVVWWFLFHARAYNTSGVLRVYCDVLQLCEADVNRVRREYRHAWSAANAEAMAPARQSADRNPYLGEVSMTGGSGSLEGEGKLMALPQNLERSCSFMTEGQRLLKWLQAEGALNESIVVELFERMRWKRATVNADRTFLCLSRFSALQGHCILRTCWSCTRRTTPWACAVAWACSTAEQRSSAL